MKFLQEMIDASIMLKEKPGVLDFCVVGSAIYHPEPKDLDFLVLLDPKITATYSDFDALTLSNGMFPSMSVPAGEYDDQDGTWCARREGNLNFICTVDSEWFKRAKLANEVCVALKLLDKGDRIVAYRVIRDGYSADEANRRRDGSV